MKIKNIRGDEYSGTIGKEVVHFMRNGMNVLRNCFGNSSYIHSLLRNAVAFRTYYGMRSIPYVPRKSQGFSVALLMNMQGNMLYLTTLKQRLKLRRENILGLLLLSGID